MNSVKCWEVQIFEYDNEKLKSMFVMKLMADSIRVMLSTIQFRTFCLPVKQRCPPTCHGGAWGERRYSSYSYLSLALDGGEWSASRPGRALPPGKEPPVPIGQEAGWAPVPVWTQRLGEKSSASVGDRNLGHPARSQSLYWLSYRGSFLFPYPV
jgi:hypothetical protein